MLDSLDTLIAIAVIMSIASLLVTLVVQMISALFSLRGKQLANGLLHVLQGAAPGNANDINELVHQVLTDPHLLAGVPTTPRGGWGWSWWNLLCGERKLAHVARPEDVYAALQRLAQLKPESVGTLDGKEKPGAAAALGTLASTADQLLKSLATDPAKPDPASEALISILKELKVQAPNDAMRARIDAGLAEAATTLEQHVDTARVTFDRLFQSAEDKSQEWFLRNIRYVTIATGFALAFVFQWDAAEIYRQVSAPDGALRSALVARAGDVIKATDGRLPSTDANGKTSVSGGLLERIAAKWTATYKGSQGWPQIPANTAYSDLGLMRKALIDQSSAAAIRTTPLITTPPPPDAAPARTTPPTPDEVARAFDDVSGAEIAQYYQDQETMMRKLASMTEFDFIPANGWRWAVAPNTSSESWLCRPVAYWSAHYGHIPGVLMFAGLLSLGAPFWYNMLRNLVNLRPTLAKTLDQEEPRSRGPGQPGK